MSGPWWPSRSWPCFSIKGACDYAGNYLINYVGFSAVTDLRQDVFDRVLHQDAQFFESNSTARVMSSIMNDLEKIQVAMSHILADLAAAKLHRARPARGGAANRLAAGAGQPHRAAVRAGADDAAGPRIRRTTRSAQDDAAELNQVLQETLSGHQVVKILRRRGNRVQPFPRPRRNACAAAICDTSRSRPSPRR